MFLLDHCQYQQGSICSTSYDPWCTNRMCPRHCQQALLFCLLHGNSGASAYLALSLAPSLSPTVRLPSRLKRWCLSHVDALIPEMPSNNYQTNPSRLVSFSAVLRTAMASIVNQNVHLSFFVVARYAPRAMHRT